MLLVNDPRWATLRTRNGDGAWVPQWLQRVLENPDNLQILYPEGWQLFSDENTWSASFAAAPYLVEAASRACAQARFAYVTLLGLIAAYRTRPGTDSDNDACPSYLEESFQKATKDALKLATGLLPLEWDDNRCTQLISAVSAFKGLLRLARGIESGGLICENCGVVVELINPKFAYDEDIPF